MKNENVYYKIPFSRYDTPRCCICKQSSLVEKEFNIAVYNRKNKTMRLVRTNLLYCKRCNLGQANPTVFRLIRHLFTGYSAEGMSVSKKSDLEIVSHGVQVVPPHLGYYKMLTDTQHEDRASGQSATKAVKTKQLTARHLTRSQRVQQQINHSCSDKDGKIHCEWTVCGEMRTSLQLKEMVISMMEDNPKYLLIVFASDYKSKSYAFIFSDHNDIKHNSVIILDYKEQNARVLLTDVFKHKKETFLYNGREYRYNGKTQIAPSLKIQPQEIYLPSAKFIKTAEYQSQDRMIVDALLYSPITECFEVLRGSYAPESDRLFFSPDNYLSLAAKYCFPNLRIRYCIPDCGDPISFSDHRAQSVYMLFGYNVSQAEDLSANDRQLILTKIIDAGISTVEMIVRFLEHMLSIHRNSQYLIARSKWKEDLEFIKRYKSQAQGLVILT